MNDHGSTAIPDAVPHDPYVPDGPDDEVDLPRERLDDDFDVASAREQSHQQAAERDPSEADEVVDGS